MRKMNKKRDYKIELNNQINKQVKQTLNLKMKRRIKMNNRDQK